MKPKIEILSRDEIERVHLTVLQILEKVGVRIHNEQALSLLKDAGAEVDEKTHRVYIPPYLLEECIRNAPKYVHLYDRNSKYKLKIEHNHSYTVLGANVLNVIDPENFERVQGRKEYVAKAARVVDALPNIHVAAQLCSALEYPPENRDVHELEAIFMNTTKPVMVTPYSPRGADKIIQMASLIKGGIDKLRKEPLIFMYIESTPPLENRKKEDINILMKTAKLSLPVVYTPCIQAGATSPVTLAGTLAQSFAESLTGLVITQLSNKGAPFILGIISTVMDMRTGVMAYGAPEFSILNAASAQLAHYYNLPFFGTGGCSDSKLPDEQAAIEATSSMLMAMLAGTNLIHDIGYIEGGVTGSLEMVVILDEVFSMLNRIVRGIDVDDETLAFDVIRDVGPGGHFLSHKHTLKHVSSEHWLPQLIDRRKYNAWRKEGAKDLLTRAREKLKKILSEHEPEPLPSDVLKDIKELVKY